MPTEWKDIDFDFPNLDDFLLIDAPVPTVPTRAEEDHLWVEPHMRMSDLA